MKESPSWGWLILPQLEQHVLYSRWPLGWPYPGIPPGGPIAQEGINLSAEVLQASAPVYSCPTFREPGSTYAKPFAQDLV
jgi:hypothetical protein